MTPYRAPPASTELPPRVPLRWVPREAPLAPRGVAARGAAGVALARRLLDLDDASLSAWRGVAAGEDLVLLGDELPWVDGATWLGRDVSAPGWLLPTALRTDLPAPLVVRAVIARGAHAAAPYAMWPEGESLRVVPLAEARPLSAARIAAWADSLRRPR